VSAHSHSAQTWYDIPMNIRAPMYLNPFFFLTASFAPPRQLYPAWTTCAAVFVAIGVLAVVLTLRNLRRRGELNLVVVSESDGEGISDQLRGCASERLCDS
jgi:hypothetical protein